MPLLKGSHKGIINANIQTLMREGRPHAQAIAIALHQARQPAKPKPMPLKPMKPITPTTSMKSPLRHGIASATADRLREEPE